MIATTLHGFEDILAKELEAIGATDIKKRNRAVEFYGDKSVLYRANYELRTAIKILEPIYEFKARDENRFYNQIRRINWGKYMHLNMTFAVSSVVNSPFFNHSKYVALKAKDAIVDQFRDKFDKRPNVNPKTPHISIHIYIEKDFCTVYLDSSGDALYKRGYRQQTVEAPLNEILAAGMILLSGWKKDCAFIDPMCGSGTLLMEAATYAYNIPPQFNRKKFAFQNWRDYDAQLWERIQTNAQKQIVSTFEYPILGFDVSPKAVFASQHNIKESNFGNRITVERKPFERLDLDLEKGMMITNPPYNERLKNKDINDFYKKMGDKLKTDFKGFDIRIISNNLEALTHIGMRASKKYKLFNGPLECSYNFYEVYE